MKDQEIIALYWKRDENAIKETKRKYEPYLFKIAQNILNDSRDSEECINDTYLNAPAFPFTSFPLFGKNNQRMLH